MTARLILHLALASLILTAGPTGAADLRTCKVDALKGETSRYWRAGTWRVIAPGQEIAFEDKIATGADARIRIVCSDGIVVTVGAATEINLEELVGPAGTGHNVVLQLIDGITGIFAPRRNWSRFEVRTNVAIASVRSTKWLVESGSGSGTAVFTLRGVVDVRVGPARYRLSDGDGITISNDGRPGPVKIWGAARIARSTTRLGFDWK